VKGDADSLSLSQRRIEDLLSKRNEVNDQLSMAEDDVAQVNDVLSKLHDSKEVRKITKTYRFEHKILSYALGYTCSRQGVQILMI